MFLGRGSEALFLCTGTLGCIVYLTPQLFIPVYLHANVGPPSLQSDALLGLPATAFSTQSSSCTLLESSPPGCPSPPLLPVLMNVFSLTPWLSDFHTVQFSASFGCFFVFKFVVVLLLVVQGGTVCLPKPPSWLEV